MQISEKQQIYPAYFKQHIARVVEILFSQIQDANQILESNVQNRALHILSYALHLPEIWPNTRNLLLTLAPRMEQAGHRDEWIPYLESGLALSNNCGDRLSSAELRFHLGYIYRLSSQFDLARQMFTASAENFAELNNRQGEARSLNQLAYIACLQHSYDESFTLIEIALLLLETTDPERAMSLSTLGSIASFQYHWQAAEAYHASALQIRIEQGDQRKIAWSLQNLGYVLEGQNRLEEAIEHFAQAIALLNNVNDPAHMAIVQMNLGSVYSRQNQHHKAIDIYLIAESIFREVGDQYNLANLSTNKGLAFLQIQDWEQAKAAFQVAINLFDKLHDLDRRLNALDGLALVYLHMQQFDKAVTICESILNELPSIANLPSYKYLSSSVTTHLNQAKQKTGQPQTNILLN